MTDQTNSTTTLQPKQIMNLLIEASHPQCSSERRDEILDVLTSVFYDRPGMDMYDIAENQRVSELVRQLYFRCEERPAMLTSLYPLFAMLALVGKGVWYTEIDWTPYESWEKENQSKE